MGLTPATARTLCDRILDLVAADSATVHISAADDQHVRFANNDISSSALIDQLELTLTVGYGRRSATVATTATDERALVRLVDQSQALAKLAPEDPEHMPPVEPSQFAEPIAWSDRTANAAPEDAVGWLRPVIERARAAGVDTAGYLTRSVGGSTLANSSGLFVQQRSTSVGFSLTARTPAGRGSGWASTQVTDIRDLDLAAVGEQAIGKALASRNPVSRAPGRTTVVLEAAAVRDLVGWLLWRLERRPFDEGRSFLNRLVEQGSDPLGAALFGNSATLLSDPLDPAAPCATHADGLPLTRTPWIENGTLKSLAVGRYWARKQGLPPQPTPGNLLMPGDGKSLDELVGMVDDGILITRIWYLRELEPETLLVTGLTRDGTFAIQQGRLAGPVQNFRFNESPLNILRRIVASGIPCRVLGSESDFPAHVPPLVVADFNLSSISDAS